MMCIPLNNFKSNAILASVTFFSIYCCFVDKTAYAYTFDLSPRLDSELSLDAQIDQYLTSDCSSVGCASQDDGWRSIDISLKVNWYTGSHSLIFGNVGLSFGNGTSIINDSLTPAPVVSTSLKDDNSDIEFAIVGAKYKQHQLSFGNHDYFSSSFNVSKNSYTSFSLSGFSDDRVDWFSSDIGETAYASSSHRIGRIGEKVLAESYDVSISLGTGVRGTDDSRVSLIHDLLFETTIPSVENLVISIASRSLSNPSFNREIDSVGLKLDYFYNDGSEYALAFSRNDLGFYAELALSKIVGHRHKLTIGGSTFNVDDSGSSFNNSVILSDARVIFYNYALASSDVLHYFLEYHNYEDKDTQVDGILAGLKLFF